MLGCVWSVLYCILLQYLVRHVSIFFYLYMLLVHLSFKLSNHTPSHLYIFIHTFIIQFFYFPYIQASIFMLICQIVSQSNHNLKNTIYDIIKVCLANKFKRRKIIFIEANTGQFFFCWQIISSKKLAFYPIFKLLFYFCAFVCLLVYCGFFYLLFFYHYFWDQVILWRLGGRVAIGKTWTLTRRALAFSLCLLGLSELLSNQI